MTDKQKRTPPRVGEMFVSYHDVERYPNCIMKAGAEGIVVESEEGSIWVSIVAPATYIEGYLEEEWISNDWPLGGIHFYDAGGEDSYGYDEFWTAQQEPGA